MGADNPVPDRAAAELVAGAATAAADGSRAPLSERRGAAVGAGVEAEAAEPTPA